MKLTSWGNSRICVTELQLPWVINIQPSGYVVDLIGCWACSEASCCGGNSLELNPAWSLCIVLSFLCSLRGGGSCFSHAPTHTLHVCWCTTPLSVHTCLLQCVCGVSVAQLFVVVLFFSFFFKWKCITLNIEVTKTWELPSLQYIIQIYDDKCAPAWLNFRFIYSAIASVRLLTLDISWVALVFII